MNQAIMLLNGQVVNEGRTFEADLLIKQGRIEQIASDLSHLSADLVIDCADQWILPGMIDDQVHFREPGLTHKGCIETESNAAVRGGITSYMEMPNCKPSTTNQSAIEAKLARAANSSAANYAFYLGATNDNLEDIETINTQLICGVKVFMGASTGDLLVNDIKALERIFQNSPVLIATHCEDTPMIEANEARYREQYGNDISFGYHPDIRSREACIKSSQLAVDLAKQYNSQLHVLHITTAEELGLFTAGEIASKHITAEACVHHLFFSADDYATLEGKIKCNPAIKLESDRQALLSAVKKGVIDIIATDHAPHTLAEKTQSYWQSPAGLPLVQEALLSLLTHVERGVLTIEEVVQKVCHNVAIRYQVKDRGFIREGYWADLVLLDRQQSQLSSDSDMAYRCGWTPFVGHRFPAKIVATFVNGAMVYQQLGESFEPHVQPGISVSKPLVFNR